MAAVSLGPETYPETGQGREPLPRTRGLKCPLPHARPARDAGPVSDPGAPQGSAPPPSLLPPQPRRASGAPGPEMWRKRKERVCASWARIYSTDSTFPPVLRASPAAPALDSQRPRRLLSQRPGTQAAPSETGRPKDGGRRGAREARVLPASPCPGLAPRTRLPGRPPAARGGASRKSSRSPRRRSAMTPAAVPPRAPPRPASPPPAPRAALPRPSSSPLRLLPLPTFPWLSLLSSRLPPSLLPASPSGP